MRIITGSKRGKKLITLEGEQVRPTTDRVKESLFNILQFQLEGRKFLDLFAGSGQIGLEALSRGAALCVFVDASKESIRVVEKNVQSTGLGDRAKVVSADFAAYLASCREHFDLAFLDPPYRTGLLERALPLVAQRMNPGGVILCEHPKDETLPESAGEFVRFRSYRYGKIMLTSYRRPEEETGEDGE
ncbi:MAG: 16S rRNA (guanine(966)-N(2))-methyltransferase RsmD [Acutalibacter sp.]|jgi:16S rRNA (guanine966-N2)-methyltransferase